MLWEESPSILIQGDTETKELKYPAVTICPKISTKYAIAERLGNYIDPLKLPEELLSLRHDFLKCAIQLSYKYGISNYNMDYMLRSVQQWKAVYKVLIENFKKLLS